MLRPFSRAIRTVGVAVALASSATFAAMEKHDIDGVRTGMTLAQVKDAILKVNPKYEFKEEKEPEGVILIAKSPYYWNDQKDMFIAVVTDDVTWFIARAHRLEQPVPPEELDAELKGRYGAKVHNGDQLGKPFVELHWFFDKNGNPTDQKGCDGQDPGERPINRPAPLPFSSLKNACGGLIRANIGKIQVTDSKVMSYSVSITDIQRGLATATARAEKAEAARAEARQAEEAREKARRVEANREENRRREAAQRAEDQKRDCTRNFTVGESGLFSGAKLGTSAFVKNIQQATAMKRAMDFIRPKSGWSRMNKNSIEAEATSMTKSPRLTVDFQQEKGGVRIKFTYDFPNVATYEIDVGGIKNLFCGVVDAVEGKR